MPDSTADDPEDGGIDDRQFPFGLSSRQFFVIVVVGAIVIPGLLVGIVEAAGYSMIGNFIWILGYGTGIFVVWYIWLRPIDLVGATEQATASNMDDSTDRDEEIEGQDTAEVSKTTRSVDSN